jgi:hypothetical protein
MQIIQEEDVPLSFYLSQLKKHAVGFNMFYSIAWCVSWFGLMEALCTGGK